MTFRRLRGSKLQNSYLAIPVDKTLASVPKHVRDEIGEPHDKEGEIVSSDRPSGGAFERELSEALLNVGWYVYDGVKVAIEEKVGQGEFPR
jgi:hypothetical protein